MAVHAPQQMQQGFRHRTPYQSNSGILSSNPVPNFGNRGGPSNQQDYGGDDAYPGFFGQRQELDAKRLRKSIYRKTVDYFTPVVKYLEERSVFVDPSNFRDALSDPTYYSEMLSCVGYPHNTSNAITTKFIRQATNKIKCPVFVVMWTPEGRRLVTGSSSGEFTLWNGLTFNFETILQAHDTAVRSMVWSRSDTWLVTGDASGFIKYWQANMNNVKSYQAHRDSIRGISFCPTDFKFATGSDDGTIRIWDFETCETLKVLRGGHGGEVKCVDWHPKRSLLVTGSRDNQQPVKLWDPRTADAIGTLYLHKGPVTDLKWNPINSNYLLSSSRDSLVKLFDLRTMKDFQTCRGHKREVMSVAWHPIYQTHFCSGGMDGSLMFWNTGTEREVGHVENAHEGSIWSMSWHPQGHILCTGSNDCSVKFWTRNRPGDTMKDKYNAKSRNETDNPLDSRGRSEFELEDEEDDLTASTSTFAKFDNQDTSEFESTVSRDRLANNAPPFQNPNQPSFPHQQFPPNASGSDRFPFGGQSLQFDNNRQPPGGQYNQNDRWRDQNQPFPHYDNRDGNFQGRPQDAPGFGAAPPPSTQQPLLQPPLLAGQQGGAYQTAPVNQPGAPGFPDRPMNEQPANSFQPRPGDTNWSLPQQSQQNLPGAQQWQDRGPLLQPPANMQPPNNAGIPLTQQQFQAAQPGRQPLQPTPGSAFPPVQQPPQPLLSQPPNWDDRRDPPPPQGGDFPRENWDRNQGRPDNHWRPPGDDRRNFGEEPPRGGLLPPPGASGPGARQDDYRGNKRPWDDQYSGDRDRDRDRDNRGRDRDNDRDRDQRGNWRSRGSRGGARGGRGGGRGNSRGRS